ncbi:hypothetical protein [Acidithiobacillus ferriphilus]|uniref:hypothetical protein n=1 Tax=Acidithiobacillus ferriphilus TaxID=1689834 RepID=UPI001D024800|nr:hypothetical protein [Acidithiobacillus ferriphilus]
MATPIKHYTLLSGNPDGTYRIDPQHTNVLFTIGHVGITQFTGAMIESGVRAGYI